MGHSIGDGIIVAALVAAYIAYLYFRHVERRKRLEIIHQERLVAMDKGIPLPELPIDPPQITPPPGPRAPLIHGIVWLALGVGFMLALALTGAQLRGIALWPLPLPLALLGGGLMLYYGLVSKRAR